MRLSINIIKSKPNKDNSFSVKIMLSHNKQTAYITTPYRLNSINEWNDKVVCGRPDAGYINSRLYDFLHRCEEISETICPDNLTVTAIKKLIEDKLPKVYPELLDGTLIPLTDEAVSKQIKAMNARIAELESQLDAQNKKVEALTKIIGILKTGNLI